jgi:hypothetical protein
MASTSEQPRRLTQDAEQVAAVAELARTKYVTWPQADRLLDETAGAEFVVKLVEHTLPLKW